MNAEDRKPLLYGSGPISRGAPPRLEKTNPENWSGVQPKQLPRIDPHQFSIERQVAFKAVIELVLAGQLNLDDGLIEEWTNRFENILARGDRNPIEEMPPRG